MNIKSRHKQLGALMVEVSIALLISALAAIGTLRENIRYQEMKAADMEADSLDMYRIAMQTYVNQFYGSLQFSSPAGTLVAPYLFPPEFRPPLAPVDLTPVNVLNPTVAELQALGLLTTGFKNNPTMVDGATYKNVITRQGANCATNPVTCTVIGIAYVDLGYYISGTASAAGKYIDSNTTQLNGPIIGQMIQRLGGYGGSSQVGTPAVISGIDWSVPNPLPTEPGIVAARFGYDTSMFQYVRIGDTRDPTLLGNLTVAGNTNFGDPAKLLNAGVPTPMASRNSVTLNGLTTVNGGMSAEYLTPTKTYALNAACPADMPAASIARTALGGLLICEGGFLRALLVRNAVGDVCAVEGSTSTTSTGLGLLCVGSKYRGMNQITKNAVVNSSCNTAGATAIDSSTGPAASTVDNYELLVCKSNPETGGALKYYRLRELTQHLTFVNSYVRAVTNPPVAMVVTKPTSCGTGTPLIQLMPATFSSTDAGFSFYAVDNGASWNVFMKNGLNNDLSPGTTAIAYVYCYAP